MKKRHNLIMCVCFAFLILSCTKNNAAKEEKLIASNKVADTDPNTGISGDAACWNDYLDILRNGEPDDYLPGQASQELTSCLTPYASIAASNNAKLYPPFAPGEIIKATDYTADYDNKPYRNFFGLTNSSTDDDYANAAATFQRYTDIACATWSEGYLQGNTYKDSAFACMAYAIANQGIFTSSADLTQFYGYLDLVFTNHAFTIDVRTSALRTDLFSLFYHNYNCIGVVWSLGSI